MKNTYIFLLFVFLFCGADVAMGQISIGSRRRTQQSDVKFRDSIRTTSVESQYFNRAKFLADRAEKRRQHNYVELTGAINGALTSFNESWIKTSGGDNNISAWGGVYFKHVYNKDKFSIQTLFDAKLGYNQIKVDVTDAAGATVEDAIWFKYQDEFSISVAPSMKFADNWSYGPTVKFRSQFLTGYTSRTSQDETGRKSTFMAPGYLDLMGGVKYSSPSKKFPINITFAPLSMSAVFVSDEAIRFNQWDGKYGWQAYGLKSEDKRSKFEGGSSLDISFERTFWKNAVKYRTTVESFYGWISDLSQENRYDDFKSYKTAYAEWEAAGKDAKTQPVLAIHPTVRWKNTVELQATKFIKTTIDFELYYNRSQNYDIQTKTLLSVGLSYTFKNK